MLKIGKRIKQWYGKNGAICVMYAVTGSAEAVKEYLEWKVSRGYREDASIVLFDQTANPGDKIVRSFGTDGTDGKYVVDFNAEVEIERKLQRRENANAYVKLFGERRAPVAVPVEDEEPENVE